MDQAQWDKRKRQIAAQMCVNTHLDVFRSTVSADGMVKNADAACHVCLDAAEQRVKKEQKAQGVEITDPEEIARIREQMGIEDTDPGTELPRSEGPDSRLPTIPDTEGDPSTHTGEHT